MTTKEISGSNDLFTSHSHSRLSPLVYSGSRPGEKVVEKLVPWMPFQDQSEIGYACLDETLSGDR